MQQSSHYSTHKSPFFEKRNRRIIKEYNKLYNQGEKTVKEILYYLSQKYGISPRRVQQIISDLNSKD